MTGAHAHGRAGRFRIGKVGQHRRWPAQWMPTRATCLRSAPTWSAGGATAHDRH